MVQALPCPAPSLASNPWLFLSFHLYIFASKSAFYHIYKNSTKELMRVRAVDESWFLGGGNKSWAECRYLGASPANLGVVQNPECKIASKFKNGPWHLLENGRCQAGKTFINVTWSRFLKNEHMLVRFLCHQWSSNLPITCESLPLEGYEMYQLDNTCFLGGNYFWMRGAWCGKIFRGCSKDGGIDSMCAQLLPANVHT